MSSGNHMVDGLDRALDAQEWRCEACGSRRDPEEANWCAAYSEECVEPCPDAIEAYLDDCGWMRRLVCRVSEFFGDNPYKHLAQDCPERVPALVCESCGYITAEV